MKTEGPNRALCKQHQFPALGHLLGGRREEEGREGKGKRPWYELHDYPFARFHFGLRNQKQFLFVHKEPLLTDSGPRFIWFGVLALHGVQVWISKACAGAQVGIPDTAQSHSWPPTMGVLVGFAPPSHSGGLSPGTYPFCLPVDSVGHFSEDPRYAFSSQKPH